MSHNISYTTLPQVEHVYTCPIQRVDNSLKVNKAHSSLLVALLEVVGVYVPPHIAESLPLAYIYMLYTSSHTLSIHSLPDVSTQVIHNK